MRTTAFLVCVACLPCLAGCGASRPEPAVAAAGSAAGSAAPPPDAPRPLDPDLDPVPRPKLLAIDWAKVSLASDADALALWAQIAPTGADWEAKLYEVPTVAIAKALAVALLRQGNFTCTRTAPPGGCGAPPPDVRDPDDTDTLADPCLRRVLALWSLDQLDVADLPPLHDALAAIVAIPPPESQLVAAVIEKELDDTDQDVRLDLLVRGWRAGQHEIVGGRLGPLDEKHLVEAVQKDHIDAALPVLSAEADRSVYVAAVGDSHLATETRVQAIADLVEADPDVLAPDLRAALFGAAKAPDCALAAAAAHALVQYHQLGPPTGPATMRNLCVAASFERLQKPEEASPLASLVPPRGLELVKVAYDPDAEVGSDGVDPRRVSSLVPREAIAFPDGDEVVRALAHCKGTTCSSDDDDFHFTLRGGFLTRLEIDERAPCKQ